MPPDLWEHYARMFRCRRFEEIITGLWQDGLISGEMHLGTGEEGIIAGIIPQLQADDALALDHRGTAASLLRGVDPQLLLNEMLGLADGLCGGQGGHMHLFSKEYLTASSGIVGASGPAALGFALSAQRLRPGRLSVSISGEGSYNQGMLMESLNLAAAWELPVLFVCKDDQWAITTRSESSTIRQVRQKVEGFGLPTWEADGWDVVQVWETAAKALAHVRAGKGPAFLHVRCVHLEGHFLGYQLIRALRDPIHELPAISFPLIQSFLAPGGANFSERLAGLKIVLNTLKETYQDSRKDPAFDPLHITRRMLEHEPEHLHQLESLVHAEMSALRAAALDGGLGGSLQEQRVSS